MRRQNTNCFDQTSSLCLNKFMRDNSTLRSSRVPNPLQDLRTARVRSYQTARESFLSQAKYTYNSNLCTQARKIYNQRTNAIVDQGNPEVPSSLNKTDKLFKQCTFPELNQRTDKLLDFSKACENQLNNKQNLKNLINKLHKDIGLTQRVLDRLQCQNNMHINNISKTKADLRKTEDLIQRNRFSADQVTKEVDQLTFKLNQTRSSNTNVAHSIKQNKDAVVDLNKLIQQLKADIHKNDKERTALKYDLTQANKNLGTIINQYSAQQSKKAQTLIFVAKHTD